MKTKSKIILAALGIAPCALTYAQPATYNWETDLRYTTRDTDIEDSQLNEDNIQFGVNYYFMELGQSNAALRELPFVSRTSSVGFDADVRELDDDIDNVVDLDTYTLRGTLVAPETGWYGKLGYVNSSADINGDLMSPIFQISPEFDGYTAEVGKYVAENTTIGLAYSEIDYENALSDSVLESGSDTIGLAFKHYGRITDNSGWAFEGNFYFIDTQIADFDELDDGNGVESSGEVFSFKATYYPSHELGVGVSYADSDDLMGRPYLTSNSAIEDGAGLFAEWFATERLSLKATYTNGDYDLSDPDDFGDPGDVETDSLTFGAAYRF